MDLYDDLIYWSNRVIVGRSRIVSSHAVIFDGKTVLRRGFHIVHFDLIGKWFTVGKIGDLHGRHTGYYCDIVTPPQLLEDGGVELTDLFLDLWVSPDLRYKVPDEEELEDAFRRGWIEQELYERSRKELSKLIDLVEKGGFPPYHVRTLENRLGL